MYRIYANKVDRNIEVMEVLDNEYFDELDVLLETGSGSDEIELNLRYKSSNAHWDPNKNTSKASMFCSDILIFKRH